MKNICMLFALLLLGSFSLQAGNNLPSSTEITKIENQLEQAKAQKDKTSKQLSEKKKAKLQKKLNKKLEKHREAGGVRVGLGILLVGAIIAVLGLAGLGGLLITIGIIVLAIGLAFWLLSLIF